MPEVQSAAVPPEFEALLERLNRQADSIAMKELDDLADTITKVLRKLTGVGPYYDRTSNPTILAVQNHPLMRFVKSRAFQCNSDNQWTVLKKLHRAKFASEFVSKAVKQG